MEEAMNSGDMQILGGIDETALGDQQNNGPWLYQSPD